MAQASRKHMGTGGQGKGSGTGAMTEKPAELVPDNTVLSNRDKRARSEDRGQDSKAAQTEQVQEHSHKRLPDGEGGGADGEK